MQSDVIYSLWSLKPCLDCVILHHAIFRNPASGHRPSRRQLGVETQDMMSEAFPDHVHSITFEYTH